MKVRAIIVVLLVLSLLAAGCVGQKSAYSLSKHNPLQSAFVHQLYGRSAVAAGLQLGGSPFAMDTGFIINDKPMISDGVLGPHLADSASAQTAGSRITYLNFTYAPSNTTLPTREGLYSTGQTWKGKTIFVSSKLSGPDKVPRTIFVKNDDGSYSSYSLTDVPAIYAYTLYGAFNTEETVSFGMVNDHGGDLELNNPSPWVIQEKVNGVWKTVFAPVAIQVITPLDQGQSTEWSWDQKLDNGTVADFGEYRALVQDKYVAPFTINKGSPAVDSRFTTYDNATANDAFANAPQVKAFSEVYSVKLFSNDLRDELISQMQFKAWMRGLDQNALKSAIASTKEYSSNDTALPALAVHSRYNNQPAWFIVFSWGTEAGSMSHPLFYVVSDSTGKQLCTYRCQ
ncbi:MAG TPA: hypothetical protein VGK13_03405 [Methanocellaceae archaeon]